jgi:hypothetical protein
MAVKREKKKKEYQPKWCHMCSPHKAFDTTLDLADHMRESHQGDMFASFPPNPQSYPQNIFHMPDSEKQPWDYV